MVRPLPVTTRYQSLSAKKSANQRMQPGCTYSTIVTTALVAIQHAELSATISSAERTLGPDRKSKARNEQSKREDARNEDPTA